MRGVIQLKDFPFILFIVFFGLYLILFTCHYKVEEFRYNSLVLSIVETAKAASFESLNNSVIVHPGTAKITIENFETSFEKKFLENVNVKLENPHYDYSYLLEADGTTKAIRIIVTDENNTKYQGTYIADIAD